MNEKNVRVECSNGVSLALSTAETTIIDSNGEHAADPELAMEVKDATGRKCKCIVVTFNKNQLGAFIDKLSYLQRELK